jgi:hypothetical protein
LKLSALSGRYILRKGEANVMTNRTVLFCALALSLAVVSASIVPAGNNGKAAARGMRLHPIPIHSLTGVSFHAVAGF